MAPYKRLINGIKKILNPNKSFKEEIHPESALQVGGTANHVPTRIPRAEHNISRRHISKNALKVLYQLHKAGYQALLVGGSVRDMLLGKKPKDFDIATNAHPDQVRQLFRNCRLIGKRFVLAHVYFGREIIEVATFRTGHEQAESHEGSTRDGQIVRDNVYGTIDEDAWRRDFTINALYYDISDFNVVDYADGMADLEAGLLRLIGDPILRYQEDPVRMLRAARFAAKLDLGIEAHTEAPIYKLGSLLENIPPARLYEEVLKLFLTGHARQSLAQLLKYDLFKYLFPYTQSHFDNDPYALKMVEHALANTDERIEQNRSVTPAFLLAALLWPALSHLLPEYREQGYSEQDAIITATRKLLNKQTKHVVIPRRISTVIQEIWLLQPRLTRRKNKAALKVMQNIRFRAGYDFLILRQQSGEPLEDWVTWWTQAQSRDTSERPQFEDNKPRKRFKRSRKPRKKMDMDTANVAKPS